jgi:hypothetical protein
MGGCEKAVIKQALRIQTGGMRDEIEPCSCDRFAVHITLGLMTTALWLFTSEVDSKRSADLLAWSSFDQIADEILASPVDQLYWEDATAPHLKGCNRASFGLTVAPDVYDAFFNSPQGYRGQFARSEADGELANRRLIDTLFPRLLVAAGNHPANADGRVAKSLRGPQAKIWIVESEVDAQLLEPQPSIIFPTWEFNAPNSQGLRAPRGTRLEVKGAWVDPAGNVAFNPAKRRRSNFIYATGDSK